MKASFSFPPNVTMMFGDQGIALRLVLNIPKNLRDYVPHKNKGRGKKFNTFIVERQVEGAPSRENLENIYSGLLKQAMFEVRVCKLKKILQENTKK